MVNSLLDTLLGKKTQEVKKVTDTTKVFQEGELGKMPDGGGNLSTYKELCSLATDMGQPDLVYKYVLSQLKYVNFLRVCFNNEVWIFHGECK